MSSVFTVGYSKTTTVVIGSVIILSTGKDVPFWEQEEVYHWFLFGVFSKEN